MGHSIFCNSAHFPSQLTCPCVLLFPLHPTGIYSVHLYLGQYPVTTGSHSYIPSTTSKKSHSKYIPSTTNKKKPLKAFASSLSQDTSDKSAIYFYNSFEPYYEFTNFYPVMVTIYEKKWPTTEHFFQAQKFVGTPYEEHIRTLSTPMEAFRFSRNLGVLKWQRCDWDGVKDDVMKLALLYKFDQNSRLRDMLLKTGKKKLVEHTFNDSYWGDGGDGSGLNKLGTLLMEVRRIMKSKYGEKFSFKSYLTFLSPNKSVDIHNSATRGGSTKFQCSITSLSPASRQPSMKRTSSSTDISGPKTNPLQRSNSISSLSSASRQPSMKRTSSSTDISGPKTNPLQRSNSISSLSSSSRQPSMKRTSSVTEVRGLKTNSKQKTSRNF